MDELVAEKRALSTGDVGSDSFFPVRTYEMG